MKYCFLFLIYRERSHQFVQYLEAVRKKTFLTCGGRSKKTEVETDQMKEAQKMEEVEQLAKMI